MQKAFQTICFPVFLTAICGTALAQAPAPTNFGSVALGASSSPTAVTFTGSAAAAGTTYSLYSAQDFFIQNPSCPGGTCTVTFSPSYPGARTGAIRAFDSSNHLLAVAVLYGIGNGPQISITPGVISSVANRASFNLGSMLPAGVAVGTPGNVFVADPANNVVRYINTVTGENIVYAGTGTAGFSGDGGAATHATLNIPEGLALDAAGNLYIADAGNNRVRKVDVVTGVITTIAGNGSAGLSGDGGAATGAALRAPTGLAIDQAGNLFIADTNNNCIREVAATTGIITTVAGTASAGISHPLGVAVDSSGNVFIADTNNHVVRKAASGTVTIVAGTLGSAGYSGDGGVATSAQLQFPWDVAVDAAGNLYIAENGNAVIRKVRGDGSQIISTIAGVHPAGYLGDGSAATSATLAGPTYMTLDAAGDIFFSDSGNYEVREITSTGAPVSFPLTPTGSSSSAVPVTISNTGNQNLSLSSLVPTSNFSNTTCPSTLAPGASCTANLTFNSTSGGSTAGTFTVSSNSLNTSHTSVINLSESNGARFIPITPCRVVDTRVSNGAGLGTPILAAGVQRDFAIPNGARAIPPDAVAYSFNVAVVPGPTLGFLTLWPTGHSRPLVATINSIDGRTKSTGAIIPAGTGGSISAFATQDTQLVLDINGYYVAPTAANYNSANALAYYPVAPCRIADTRVGSLPFGGPSFAASEVRNYPILSSACNVPATAKAYSLSFAAVPRGPLAYLTVWPTGQPQPYVASLNDLAGTTTANAVIVPAGTGGNISVFSTHPTDLVIDMNGYFAPPGTGGLTLYAPSTPCRVADTRGGGGAPAFVNTLPFAVVASDGTIAGDCASQFTTTEQMARFDSARAYVFNATAVPTGVLGFLTFWPANGARPFVSVLNAIDAAVTSNLAIASTTNGTVNVYASNPTYLVLDLFGYFAP